MKRYAFRLAPVLRVRRSEEDAARGALLAATAAVTAAEAALDERRAAYVARTSSTSAGSAREFLQEQAMRSAMGSAVLDQQAHLAAALGQQAEARALWTAAAARVGALERLDERQRAEHRAAELKEDDLITDEIVVARHGRVSA